MVEPIRFDHTTVTFAKTASLLAVLAERGKQDEKWGQQEHDPAHWMLILMEEVGEFSQAVLDAQQKGSPREHIREELVQVVAVAMSMLECCDRNGWSK